MSLQSFTVTIITKSDSPFNVIPSAPIEIRERLSNGSSGTLSLIFSDQAGTIGITQPGALANSLGQFTFFAAASDYNAVYDNNGTPVTIAVDVGVTSATLNAAIDKLSPATMAVALADNRLVVDDPLNLKENVSGSGGGAMWDTVLASGVTPDGVFIRQCTGVPSLALVYRLEQNTAFADQLGIIPGSGQTEEIKTLLAFCHDNSIKVKMTAGTYTVDEQLLTKTTSGVVNWSLKGVIFDYVGVEITRLFQATELDAIQVIGGRIQANDLIANPIDLERNTGTPTGNAIILGLEVVDTKQTTVTRLANAIRMVGGFPMVTVQGCLVDGVSRVTTSQSCSGIALAGMSGLIDVSQNIVKNVSTPDDKDADGITVFGSDVATITSFLGAKAEIHNNVINDCAGRFIKCQISDAEIHTNQMKLSASFTTITEWRGIDMQANNGDIHSNTFVFGAGITFGSSANLYTLQNIRNDGTAKRAHVYKNRCSSLTNMKTMFNLLSNFGICDYNLHNNSFTGAALTTLCTHRVTTLATTDSIRISLKDNPVTEIFNELFDPFDDVDFGSKLFLEIYDNSNAADNGISIYDEAKTSFSVGANMKISNNRGFKDRVNWIFDMDDLPGGNAFFTGGQVIPNRGTGMVNFFWVVTQGWYQKNTNGVTSVERSSLSGTSWPDAWF